MPGKRCRKCFTFEDSDEEIEDRLEVAAAEGHIECVRKIMNHMEPFGNHHWEYLTGAMFGACDGGYNDIIEMVLKVGVNIKKCPYGEWKCVDAQNSHLQSNIFRAISYNHIDTVKLLIRWNANVNHLTRDLWTPLYMAAHYGNNKIMKILLKAGARMDPVDIYGWTPLTIAANKVTAVRERLDTVL